MSATSIDRVRQRFAQLKHAAETGEWEAYLEGVHPEVEWIPREVMPETEIVRGRDGIRARFKLLWEDFEQIEFEPEEIIDAGDDTFVVHLYIAARGKASEAQVDARMYQVMRFRDDMLFRLNWYATRDEALEAAGLSE